MKIQNVILLVIMSVTITGGAIAFGYFISQEEQQDTEKSSKSNTASTTQSQSGSTGLSVASSGGTGQLLGENIDPSGNSSGSTSNAQLPTPDQFEAYEQYADEEGTLVAEIEIGTGNEPTRGDLVAVVYQGWLTDGTLFDQSKTNENNEIEPFVFELGAGQVIQGWEQGIAGMKVGGRRRLVIPSQFGYGEQGQNSIPPNAMLIFDVELVQIQPQGPPSGL